MASGGRGKLQGTIIPTRGSTGIRGRKRSPAARPESDSSLNIPFASVLMIDLPDTERCSYYAVRALRGQMVLIKLAARYRFQIKTAFACDGSWWRDCFTTAFGASKSHIGLRAIYEAVKDRGEDWSATAGRAGRKPSRGRRRGAAPSMQAALRAFGTYSRCREFPRTGLRSAVCTRPLLVTMAHRETKNRPGAVDEQVSCSL